MKDFKTSTNKVLMELDRELKSATLLQLGNFASVESLMKKKEKFSNIHNSEVVIIDLDAEELELDHRDKSRVSMYILSHTLNNNVYKLTLAASENKSAEACQIAHSMLV